MYIAPLPPTTFIILLWVVDTGTHNAYRFESIHLYGIVCVLHSNFVILFRSTFTLPVPCACRCYCCLRRCRLHECRVKYICLTSSACGSNGSTCIQTKPSYHTRATVVYNLHDTGCTHHLQYWHIHTNRKRWAVISTCHEFQLIYRHVHSFASHSRTHHMHVCVCVFCCTASRFLVTVARSRTRMQCEHDNV